MKHCDATRVEIVVEIVGGFKVEECSQSKILWKLGLKLG